jgi:RHS repeat-associated protein
VRRGDFETGAEKYQYRDRLGSSTLECNEDGEVISLEEYYPYGASAYRASRSDQDLSLKRYRFTGKERDEETGLDYFGVRYYASWLGRWTSGDPGGFVDGLNLYRYTRNNPVNGVDAEGYKTEEVEPELPSVKIEEEDKRKQEGISTDSNSSIEKPDKEFKEDYVKPVGEEFAYKLAEDINALLISIYGKENAPQVKVQVTTKERWVRMRLDPIVREFVHDYEEVPTGYYIMPKEGTPWYERSQAKKSGRYIKALFEQLVTKEVSTKVEFASGRTPADAYTLKQAKGFTYSPSSIKLWNQLPTLKEFEKISKDKESTYKLLDPVEYSYYDDDGYLVEERITEDPEPTPHAHWTLSGTFLHELVNHVNYKIGSSKHEPAKLLQNIFRLPVSSDPNHRGTESQPFSSKEQQRIDNLIKKYRKK